MEYISSYLWSIATILLVMSGIYYSFKLHFLQFNFKEIIKSLKNNKNNKNGISPFESLVVSMGSCIGVGSLAGIALAIFKGGVGVIFWVIISCLLMSSNSLVENALAIVYREKKDNNYIGGPAFYIKKGLGYNKLSLIYSIIICIAYLFGFLTIQSNTIATSITTLYKVPSILIGIIIGIISFLIIRKGIKGIAKFSSFFVPLMGIIYLLVSLFIIIKNIDMLPNLFSSIIHEAFNYKSIEYGLFTTIIIGIQRGIFASEIGSGTSAIASASSNIENPIRQGQVSILGVYFTIFVICLSTALIILTSNYNPLNYSVVNGIEITGDALRYHLGDFGNVILYFSLIAFSFSTIISGYYYVESNLSFIFKSLSKNSILILKIITCLLLVISTVISPDFIWNLSDTLVALLVIINVYSILNLKKDVFKAYLDYKLLK